MGTPTEPPSRSVRILRFGDWRALRAHVAEEARRDAGGLLLLTGTDGARAALEDAVRQRLLAGRESAARLPAVRTPALAVADLLQRSDPPGTLATPLARSLMMENALLAHQRADGAPRGNPLRLAGPLLGFLDEQARDRRVEPGRPVFGALLRRAARTFGEHREADAGAERLFRLTGWLERVHASYLEQLRASGALDLDRARRRLLGAPPEPPWSEVRAVGDQATGLADNHLFGSLLPAGRLHVLLLEDDPTPELPEGWNADEETTASAAATAPFVFVPAAPEPDEPFLFRRTDRAGEAQAAVALLRRYHQRSGLGFPGFDRCAVAARNPASVVEALAARLTEAGVPFQTRVRPSLAEEPWPAGLDDALAFAERPGCLSNGMALLRSPFFRDDRLPLPPGRLADLAESRLAEADIPNTHEPDGLEALAGTVRRLADDRLAEARRALEENPDEGGARREERAGRELGLAADAVARLAAYARALAPIREGATPFRTAVRAFAAFVTDHFAEAPDDRALEALRQAADPALPDTPVGDPARFRDRVRRQLRRQEATRYPGRSGVHLIAAEDAPFGDYDCLLLLGVGDADWPGPRPGNIFFPTRVLEPATRRRFAGARGREARLLGSFAGLAGEAAGFTRAELEDGFPAGASPLASVLGSKLEEVPERLPVALAEDAAASGAAPLPARLARAAPGAVDLAARPLSPSALVLYSRNPAQYFLERVLRLGREEALSDTGSRTARGSRLHRLMEEAVPTFAREHGPLGEDSLDAALAFFRERWRALDDPALTPEVRAAEELWLFGGESHPGALEWFLREEAGRGPSRPVQTEEGLEGTVEPATDGLPALRVRGFVDRVDEGPDGALRVMEYKSGASAGRDEAFLQARLYARLAGGGEPAGIAVPFFRDRVWGEPGNVDELDDKIRNVRDGLAGGAFPVPDEIKSFDWPLAIRPDLPDAAPERPRPAPPPPSAAPSPAPPASSFRPSDHDQRVAAGDPKRHVVLRASAGTGKTTVLTERYRNLVRAGVPPRHILALTFTRKAAAEMKERIVKRLAGADVEGNPDLAEVGVSTLDAFNLGLIREFPLDAGVAPGVEVLDEREMPVLQQEAVERVLSGATGFDRRTLAELPLLGKSLSRLDEIAKTFLDNRLTWRDTFEEEADRRARRTPSGQPVLRDRFGPVADDIGRFLGGYGGPVPLPVRLALRLLPRTSAGDALDREFLTAWLRPDLKTAPRGTAGLVTPVKPEYQRLKQILNDFNLDWLDSLNERTFGPVWDLLQAVESEYDALKEDRGVMDFDDLTSRATRLLRNTGEFAESRFRLEARYHHLLLDEFQDTSDPQWRLLRAIAEPWTHGAGLAAEEVRRVTGGRLREPTIFVVGDHKQSIYRFRNARVEILGGAERWIRESFRTRPREWLRWNFRSTSPLRRFVNDVARVVAEDDAGTEADWRFRYDEQDELQEDADPAGVSGSAPLAVSFVKQEPKEDPKQAHGEAARRVAARVAALAAEGVPLDDIAILARVSTRLSTYREAVERLGLPTYLVRGAGFFETSEVRDLTALARFLARPASDLRAVELLRSRFFAVPAAALAGLRAAEPSADTPFSDLLRSGGTIRGDLPGDDAAALREAGERAAAWIALSLRLPPSLAVRRILADTDYLARARATDGGGFAGRQQAANVERVLQHLQRVERSGFATFAAVARHLESAAANGHDATQAPLRAAGAVQVLTIHAAKGLEYEQVFLVDLNARTRGPGGGLRVQEGDDGRWSIALIGDSSDWEIRDGGRSSAEERRCLYVGMTRAKRGLTLSGTTRFTAKGAPGKAQGLAGYLPPDLWLAAASTAREPRPEIAWKRHRLAVLPAADSG